MTNDLFKTDQIASAIKNTEGEYRILAVDGKAIYAERFASPTVREPAGESSNPNTLLLGALVVFGFGVIAGAYSQNLHNAATIRQLTAEKLVLEAKLSKIRDLVK